MRRDLRGAQQLLQLTDACFLLTLFFAGGVVTAVFLEVTFFTPLVDLGRDDGTIGDELVQFRLRRSWDSCVSQVTWVSVIIDHFLRVGAPGSVDKSCIRNDRNSTTLVVPPWNAANGVVLSLMQQYTAPMVEPCIRIF